MRPPISPTSASAMHRVASPRDVRASRTDATRGVAVAASSGRAAYCRAWGAGGASMDGVATSGNATRGRSGGARMPMARVGATDDTTSGKAAGGVCANDSAWRIGSACAARGVAPMTFIVAACARVSATDPRRNGARNAACGVKPVTSVVTACARVSATDPRRSGARDAECTIVADTGIDAAASREADTEWRRDAPTLAPTADAETMAALPLVRVIRVSVRCGALAMASGARCVTSDAPWDVTDFV